MTNININIYLEDGLAPRWQKLLNQLNQDEIVRRLFAKDASLFDNKKPLMLGWLDAPKEQLKALSSQELMKKRALQHGFSSVILLGMGGSSLCARVFKDCLEKSDGMLFVVLDTIHPSALKRLEQEVDIRKSLFIIASKSGTTLEPNLLYHHFHDRLEELNISCPAEHFMAITDPITALEKLAVEQGFLQGPFGNLDIGGRYSALSPFGIMPALFMGIDAKDLLLRAQNFAEECAKNTDINTNPAALLGAFLGINANDDRSLLNLFFSKELRAFGPWLEQLLAESLGKDDLGIVPIINPEPINQIAKPISSRYMNCLIAKKGDEDLEKLREQLEKDGLPYINIWLDDLMDLGALMFMWEVATSFAGMIIGVNPFDQPDVEKSKEIAKSFMNKGAGKCAEAHSKSSLVIYSPKRAEDPASAIDDFLKSSKDCSFAVILSYLDECPANQKKLCELALKLGQKLAMPVLIQDGPRYLHSTGQLFKGGKNDGCFIMLTGPYPWDYPSEIKGLGIKDIHLSQALGDEEAMHQAKRRLVRVNLFDINNGFRELFKLI